MLHLYELCELDSQIYFQLFCQCTYRLLHKNWSFIELVPEFFDLLKFLNVSFISSKGWLSLDHHFFCQISNYIPFIRIWVYFLALIVSFNNLRLWCYLLFFVAFLGKAKRARYSLGERLLFDDLFRIVCFRVDLLYYDCTFLFCSVKLVFLYGF